MKRLLIARRYRGIRYIVFIVLIASLCVLVLTSPSQEKVRSYPRDLESMRHKEIKHVGNQVYLDYTGAGVYSDAVIDEYIEDLTSEFYPELPSGSNSKQTANELSNEIRDEILDFVGADKNEYSVVFVASATQALKLVGENFPFDENSQYVYTRYNHNSVLGIRKYAIHKGADFKPVAWPPNFNEIRNIHINEDSYNLLVFPFEENFGGAKVSPDFLREITHDKEFRKHWAIVGDTAAFLPTNPLNLTEYPVDAVIMSFYKIMGYPNTGALVIRNSFAEHLIKTTYAAHSVEASLSNENVYKLHERLPFKLEDDCVPLQMNIAVRYGLKYLKSIGMHNVQKHVRVLTERLSSGLRNMFHSTGIPLAELYETAQSKELQGGIVAFNLRKPNGEYIGYFEVVKEASEAGFHLRGGCHCNPGACFKSVGISENQVKAYYDQKTTCGDSNDIIDDIPLGAVRASLGWASTELDVDRFLKWVGENFLT